jgi:hypothetical protein
MRNFRIRLLPDSVSVCRLPADAQIPRWALTSPVFSITRTTEELSVVCNTEGVPQDAQAQGPWRIFQLEGPIPFTETGVLAKILNPLAERKIGIFSISTFDTDYILVAANDVESAASALRAAGHAIVSHSQPSGDAIN